MKRPWLSLRRKLIKKAEIKYLGQSFAWIGGVLYFKDTKRLVPGVQHVPKLGRPTIGLAALANKIRSPNRHQHQ